ncbi:FkbM family methyltransferase [Thermodesulfobacteriota bacterium]
MNLDKAFNHLYKTYFGELQIEKYEIENLPNLLINCKIFIDVGASLGMYTYYANKILQNASIIAIEADPDRYKELKKNCVKWEQEGPNKITAINKIIGDCDKLTTFYKTGTNISGSLFPVNERSNAYEPIEISQITIDEYYESGKKIVIKIDVEGGEYRVMQGATKHLNKNNTDFLIEMHWWGDRERGTTSLHLLKFLYSKKFSITKTTKVHTSNYLFQPAKEGQSLLPLYLRYAPLLLAKTIYGKYIPLFLRNIREKSLNKRRKRKYRTSLENENL